MSKPIVQFRHDEGFDNWKVGQSAYVFPIDHPLRSNKSIVRTSVIVKINDDGSFETLNTIYQPQKRKQE